MNLPRRKRMADYTKRLYYSGIFDGPTREFPATNATCSHWAFPPHGGLV